jgi:hypothetical protein
MDDAEERIAGYFAAYESSVADLGRRLRARLRARLPRHAEIVYVYERQRMLLVSYSPSLKGYDGLCSLAVTPDKVRLFFANGTSLRHADPGRLLQGRGTARFVELRDAADFDRPEIEALLSAASELAGGEPVVGAPGSIVLKEESQKARSRRRTRDAHSPKRDAPGAEAR